jgi:nitrogenase-stabilizing/protective protein
MNMLNKLEALSSAEDFFTFLEVPFDPLIVRVARLHIMRRMGQYIKGSQIDGAFDNLGDEEIRALCREHLGQAYADFVESSPIRERVFKVHKEAVEAKPDAAKPFVSLTAITNLAKSL